MQYQPPQKNVKIPKGKDPKELTLEECIELAANAPEKRGRFGRFSTPAKTAETPAKTPAKKAAKKDVAVAEVPAKKVAAKKTPAKKIAPKKGPAKKTAVKKKKK